MAMENKRITQLSTERLTLTSGDYVMVDDADNGSAKYRLDRLKETDNTLSVSGKAADAAATGQAISDEAEARENADNALGNDVRDLLSVISKLEIDSADGEANLIHLAKYYDGYYASGAYTGTGTEIAPSTTWCVALIPVIKGKKIVISNMAEGGTQSAWLNSNSLTDINSTFLSTYNNGTKRCVTDWLALSVKNAAANSSSFRVMIDYVDMLESEIEAVDDTVTFVAKKENIMPLYKSDLVYGYFNADSGNFINGGNIALTNNKLYKFPFDVIVKDLPSAISNYRIVTFSSVVPFDEANTVFIGSTTYTRTAKTTIHANTVFCLTVVGSSTITADSINGAFIGWPDFEELKEDVEDLSATVAGKTDKSYVDDKLDLKADKTYVDTELDLKAGKSYVDTNLGLKAEKTYVDNELATKANLTDLTTPYNFKGDCTYSELPVSAAVNDTWYVTDRKYRMTWNGTAWHQSSMSEGDYEDELSEIDDRLDHKDKQLWSWKDRPDCAITFTDDDGHEEVYTILRPICLAKNCKYTSAYVTGSANMTDAQLEQLQEDGLFEFISHSHTHLPPDERTEEVLRADFEASIAWLKAHNMNYEGYAAPGGNTNARTRRIIKEYFKYNLSGFAGIATSPLFQFDIPRVTLFPPNETYTLSTYTDWVDKVYENGGWLVFIGHCWEQEFNAEMLSDLIDYIQNKGIEIISTAEGIERFGNLIDLGDHSLQNDVIHEYLSVGKDGAVHATGNVIIQNEKNVRFNTPITYFPKDKLTCLTIVDVASDFPDAEGGNLWTMRISQRLKDGNASDIDSFQLWFPYFHQSVYKRRWNTSTNSWGDFVKIGPGDTPGSIVTTANAFVASSKPSDIAAAWGTSRVVITPIYSSNTEISSFPLGEQGYLTTYNIQVAGSYGQVRQEYRPQRCDLVFGRWWNPLSSSWSNWKRISGNYAESSQSISNLRSADLSAGDMIFNTTLEKPIWRNASNNGWVDATGAVVSLS